MAIPPGYYLPQPSELPVTMSCTPPNWVAPQVVPIGYGGGSAKLTSQHRRVRKGNGVDMESAAWGRCPGSYTPYPYGQIAAQAEIAQAATAAQTAVNVAGSTAADNRIVAGKFPFSLFRPTGL